MLINIIKNEGLILVLIGILGLNDSLRLIKVILDEPIIGISYLQLH